MAGRAVPLLAAMAVAMLLAVGVALVVASEPVQAAFPGKNGKIAWGKGDEIYTMNADGSHVRALTDNSVDEGAPDWQPLPVPPSPERCTISGTDGGDYLRGTSHDDVICAKGGSDVIAGRGGADVLKGGPGSDAMVGGAGADELYGQEGSDSLDSRDGVRGNDSMEGGGGTDACLRDRGDAKSGCEAK